jgi:EpsI family protein
LLIPAFAMARWTHQAGLQPQPLDRLPLPERLGEWRMLADEQLDAEALSIIRPDGHLLRSYQNGSEEALWLYVGYYTGRWGRGTAHVPEVCYPAQGWEVAGWKSLAVDLGAGEELHATLLEAERGGAEEVVIYWYQPAGRWSREGGTEQILRAWDAALGHPQYAFVRLSVRVRPGESAQADALLDFARSAAPAIRAMVEASGNPDASAR